MSNNACLLLFMYAVSSLWPSWNKGSSSVLCLSAKVLRKLCMSSSSSPSGESPNIARHITSGIHCIGNWPSTATVKASICPMISQTWALYMGLRDGNAASPPWVWKRRPIAAFQKSVNASHVTPSPTPASLSK